MVKKLKRLGVLIGHLTAPDRCVLYQLPNHSFATFSPYFIIEALVNDLVRRAIGYKKKICTITF